MTSSNAKRDNIPVPAALLLLGAVLWVLIAGPNLNSIANLGDQIESFMDRNGALVMIVVALMFFRISCKWMGKAAIYSSIFLGAVCSVFILFPG